MGVVGVAIMIVLFILPAGLGLGAFTYAGFHVLDGDGDCELLHLMLAGVWVFWMVFPLIGFSLNQSYDLTRLFIYPLSRRMIFVANLLGCCLDPTLLLVLPLFAVIVASQATSLPALVLIVPALLLFLMQTIALSQAILWALLNVLRSRRIRDWAILLAPLVMLAFYIAPHLLVRGAVGGDVFGRVIAWRPSRYFGYTPVGMAAGTVICAARGAWLGALGYLLGGAAYLLLTIALGGFVLSRLHLGEIGAGPAAGKQEVGRWGRFSLPRLATTPLAVLALKEVRYYWRDPRHKAAFIVPLVPVLIVAAGVIVGQPWPPSAAIIFAGFVCLFTFTKLFQNAFGIDREGLRLLFVTPCPRGDVLLGKNIAGVGTATLATSVAVLATGAVIGDAPLAVICTSFVLPVAILLAAVGNVVSIHFPTRLARRGENPFTTSSGRQFIVAFVSLAAFLTALVIASPVLAAGALPMLLARPVLYAVTAPVSVLYAVLVYAAILRFYSADALQRNETRILEECLVGEPA